MLAAMILAEQDGSGSLAEKTKSIYKEMKEAHPWLTSEDDLPFAALMAVSGRDASAVYAEAEEIYALLKEKLKADKNTMQMLSHILAIRSGRAEEKCEKLCALAAGLKAAGHSLGRGSRLAILGILADSGLPADTLVDRICEADDFLKQHKPFHGLFGVGRECRRMFAVQMGITETLNAPKKQDKRKIFFNRVICGNKTTERWNDGIAIKGVISWIKNLLDPEDVLEFKNYSQFAEEVLDIYQDICPSVELTIDYDPDAFNPVDIIEVLDR